MTASSPAKKTTAKKTAAKKTAATAPRKEAVDEKVDKRRVTMTNVTALGSNQTATIVAEDYVRPQHLEAYLAVARTRWQVVEVSDEFDAGPAGYHGATHVPADLPVPDAGVTYPATDATEKD